MSNKAPKPTIPFRGTPSQAERLAAAERALDGLIDYCFALMRVVEDKGLATPEELDRLARQSHVQRYEQAPAGAGLWLPREGKGPKDLLGPLK